ncbi:Nitrate transporter 1.3 [Platanthera guangdongensis]|uniref:Nitrate transporter 1.3 n=1 Tax=Platanthera guangdongensis TaxID=2320717 RepID=A0ABR2LU41_9ASPA
MWGGGGGYGISAAALAGAVMVLLAGTPRYRFRRPQGSPLTVVARVLWRAWRNRGLPHPPQDSQLNGYAAATVPHTRRLRFLDKAAIVRRDENSFSVEPETRENGATSTTLTEVEEVKMVLKLLPVWGTSILFWTIYSQMTTFSVEQATYMNRKVGAATFPSGSMSFFLFISILLVTSLNQKVLVPLARRLTRNNQGLTSLQRIGVGLIFSVASMAVAAAVEKSRRDLANDGGAIISVFWLVPQFCLVGIGEGFAYVGQLEFFIREAPERMKSMSTGLFISTISMGFFLSSVLVTVVDRATNGGWIKDSLDRGRLDYFYWMLVVLGVLNYIVFLAVGRKHQYKVHVFQWKNQDEGSERFCSAGEGMCEEKCTGEEELLA